MSMGRDEAFSKVCRKSILWVVIINAILLVAMYGIISAIKIIPHLDKDVRSDTIYVCIIVDIGLLIISIFAISKVISEMVKSYIRNYMPRGIHKEYTGGLRNTLVECTSIVDEVFARKYRWKPRFIYPLAVLVGRRAFLKVVEQESITLRYEPEDKEQRSELKRNVKHVLEEISKELGVMELISVIFWLVNICSLCVLVLYLSL